MPPVKKKPVRRVRRMKLPDNLVISYKDSTMLSRFVSEQGAIVSREESGLSAKLQRKLAREIKRARHLALLPFTQTLG